MDNKLSHFDDNGKAIMVDISSKDITERRAVAQGKISMKKGTVALITESKIEKGDVLGVARVAAIMAAKKAYDIIPMCHPLMLTGCKVEFNIDADNSAILIKAEVKTCGKTGVEMEALTMVSAAALTIYDMCKAVDKNMVISDICVVEKLGGKSGHWRVSED